MTIIQSALRGSHRESRLVEIKHPKSKAQAQEQSYWFLMRLLNISFDAEDAPTRARFANIYQKMLAEHIQKYCTRNKQ